MSGGTSKGNGSLSARQKKLAASLFLLSDLSLLCGTFRVPVPLLSLWFLPYLLLIAGLAVLFSRRGGGIHNRKRAAVLLVIAALSYFSVRLLLSAGTFPAETIAATAAITPIITHTTLAFGCLVLFLPPDQVGKWSGFFAVVPVISFAVYLCLNPGIAAVLVILFLLAYAVLRFKLLPKEQKDMIKGAAVGSIIAGSGGAVVGAMVAKERHEARNAGPMAAGSSSAAKDMVKGAAVGSLIAGDGGAVVGAMAAKEKHKQNKA